MSYDGQRSSFDREHTYIVEMDLDYCPLVYGDGACQAGTKTITTTAVATDDFNAGDIIYDSVTVEIGKIVSVTGSSPTYTIEYKRTATADFTAGVTTIFNATATGQATKDANAPVLATAGDDKCFQTFETCDDLANYEPAGTITTGEVANDFLFQFSKWAFWRQDGGNYLLEGFNAGDLVRVSGFNHSGNNGIFTVASTSVNGLEITDISGTTVETGNTGVTITKIDFKTYRFCEPRSPHPIAINAIPSLSSVSLTPSKIDVAGGMGERSSVSLTFNDHPHNDLDIDQYTGDRSYIATDRGTFWTKFRARNPNYQFRSIRVLTGYLENGEYKKENFKTRHYVIEKMSISGGKCSITAKDPLKLASAKKAQVPKPNLGLISNTGGISDAEPVAITLEYPAGFATTTGVGDAEYATSGYVLLSGSEIASFTRSGDTMTLTGRGLYNTTAKAHDEDVTVQQCYQKTADVEIIAHDILVNYAGVDASYINLQAWSEEVQANQGIDGQLNGIIVKPADVNKVLKELAEAKPHFIYWDELNQTVNFTAIQEPPTDANAYNMHENFIADSMSVKDLPDMRASTVYYTFGQIDPTKSLTDTNNYTQTVVRSNTDSISKYGSNQIKTVVSRWIDSTDKVSAENAAQILGRRFSDIPREVQFSLDDKDNELNIGDTRALNHRDMVDPTGAPVNTIFQIISKQEARNFKYKGIEFTFGPSFDGDNDIDVTTIKVSVDEQNLNLYDRYVLRNGVPSVAVDAVFQIESGVVVGSATTSGVAVETGTTSEWPSGSTITINNYGWILGAGGNGAGPYGSPVATSGSDALSLAHDVTLNNYGVIGGGGGGYAGDFISGFLGGATWFAGGGAGSKLGVNSGPGNLPSRESGGDIFGGDLGETPVNSIYGTSGTGGKAIDINGFTITPASYSTTDLRGVVS